jgi:hypothetical protein
MNSVQTKDLQLEHGTAKVFCPERSRGYVRSGATVSLFAHHRGFTTVTAVLIMGLVGAVATAMVTMVSADLRRTRGLAEEAQMREMFLAANAQVIEQSQNWAQPPAAAKTSLPLPDSLRAQEASLEMNINPDSGGLVLVTLTARIAKHASRQELTMKRAGEKWQIAAAQLLQ